MGGCTDCGKKGGCDTRKHGMFAAVDEALARLYPTRRWGERDETAALDAGIFQDEGRALAEAITARLGTLAFFQPGGPQEWCDYIYVLCLGRTPAVVELRAAAEGGVGGAAAVSDSGGGAITPVELVDDGAEHGLDERYLRVALSGVARFAGVQEVTMTLRRHEGEAVVTESARSGVFDPILLPRFQALVAVLAARDIRHIDFGEIVEAPAGFDDASYTRVFGTAPVIANYLFYPQPPTTISTVVLAAATDGSDGGVSSSA